MYEDISAECFSARKQDNIVVRDDLHHLDKWLVVSGHDGGKWMLRHRKPVLAVIASWGGGWDHVSISTPVRCPTWDEMVMLKDLFFHPTELVIQYHPPKSHYVDVHPYCLHLWRPQEEMIPVPPLEYV